MNLTQDNQKNKYRLPNKAKLYIREMLMLIIMNIKKRLNRKMINKNQYNFKISPKK